jgi:hypothetical protein
MRGGIGRTAAKVGKTSINQKAAAIVAETVVMVAAENGSGRSGGSRSSGTVVGTETEVVVAAETVVSRSMKTEAAVAALMVMAVEFLVPVAVSWMVKRQRQQQPKQGQQWQRR